MVAAETKASAQCSHRNKSKLFQTAAVRKVLKNTHADRIICVECNRTDSTEKSGDGKSVSKPSAVVEDLWICVHCGQVICEQTHLKKHVEAARSGGQHHIVIHLCTSKIRCEDCNVELVPGDNNNDVVKKFQDEMRSFLKTKMRTPTTERNGKISKDEPIVNGTHSAPEKPAYTIKTRSAMVPQGIRPIKGLPNIGNTCFFNSVMQCIMHTVPIGSYLENVAKDEAIRIPDARVVTVCGKKVEVPKADIALSPTDMHLLKAFQHFIVEFQCGRNPNPKPLYEQMCRKVPRYRSHAQQDAHELLRHLLDGLRQEELDRFKEAINKYMGNPKPDPETRQMAKALLECAGPPVLDSVFGGKLLQTIVCSKCSHVSTRFEPFFDLSLPIPDVDKKDHNPSATSRVRKASESGGMSKHQRKKAQKLAKKNKGKNSRMNSECENGRVDAKQVKESHEEDVEPMDHDADGDATHANNIDVENEEHQLNVFIENGVVDEDECTDDEEPSGVDYTAVLGEAPANGNDSMSLENALRQFTAVDQLAGPNAYECERCCAPANKKKAKDAPKMRVDAEKRYLVFAPPAILTLHLKRFVQVPTAKRVMTRKFNGHVSFESSFNLAPFTARHGERLRRGQKKLDYRLYGVVSHHGDMSSGHYVAYVRSRLPSHSLAEFFKEAFASRTNLEQRIGEAQQNGIVHAESQRTDDSESDDPDTAQWFYASDSATKTVSETEVLKVQAYVLFYERTL